MCADPVSPTPPPGSQGQAPVDQTSPSQQTTKPTLPQEVQDALTDLKESITKLITDQKNGASETTIDDDKTAITHDLTTLSSHYTSGKKDQSSLSISPDSKAKLQDTFSKSNFSKDLNNLKDDSGNSLLDLMKSGNTDGIKNLLSTLTDSSDGIKSLSSLSKDAKQLGTNLGNNFNMS